MRRPIRCQACQAPAEVVEGVFPEHCAKCGCGGWWRIDWLKEMQDDPMFDAGDKRVLATLNISPK